MNIILQYWQPAVFSFLLSVVFGIGALKLFPKWGLMDKPRKYGLLRKPIPYSGGLVIFLAFLVSVILFVPMDKHLVGLLFGSGLVLLVGFLDDRFDLSPLLRIVFQFIGAVILVISGIGVLSINLPFFGALDLSTVVWGSVIVLSAVFTVLWVMTFVNVMNFLDGVSGLNSGVSFIAGITLFVLSIHPTLHADPASQVGVATIALIVAMVSFGFLIFDFPKPKMLMGDSGSTFLGFVLATLAIFSGGKVATAFLVLGIPLLDLVWVVLRRTFVEKKAFWKGDLKHLHHRLLDVGFSERQVVIIYFIVTAIFGFTAVSLVSSQQKFFMIIALVVLMVLLAGALVFVPKRK